MLVIVTDVCDIKIVYANSVTMLGASAKYLTVLQERAATPGQCILLILSCPYWARLQVLLVPVPVCHVFVFFQLENEKA